ncbi:MAG: hypothetical protein KBT03_01455 [Bacteroidales bacterium]|nr:hypothetical protein [Candidatus Scybalousia scybalohippi]
MNPHIINIYMDAEKLKQKRTDEEQFVLGMYIREALLSTVCNSFIYKKKTDTPNKYPSQPFSYGIEENTTSDDYTNLTDEDKKKKTEDLFLKLRLMMANNNISKRE